MQCERRLGIQRSPEGRPIRLSQPIDPAAEQRRKTISLVANYHCP